MTPTEGRLVVTQELPVHLRQVSPRRVWSLKPSIALQLQTAHAANVSNRRSSQYIEAAALIECQCSSNRGGDVTVSCPGLSC